ncbi:hypothetical protein GCM10009098_10390 [Rheinheimera aquimaris]|uniref:Class IIb bacteriocin, lactobin A/cerein 7B family n=1 Tax=Rheinheimera aquimaris TaxID=412437 RepID=A0ABP3NKT9_9GAMM|nr:class IIb bacteriocin, lactobin A/cerein 7B family [Rheinheimera aquimaris]MCB5212886.1 class IIb bacteriocin, lactobin A/cerein 7B family [Rheinheimera aquimaris]
MKDLTNNEVMQVSGGFVCGGLCVAGAIVAGAAVGSAVAYWLLK